jgi:hypothetical protein
MHTVYFYGLLEFLPRRLFTARVVIFSVTRVPATPKIFSFRFHYLGLHRHYQSGQFSLPLALSFSFLSLAHKPVCAAFKSPVQKA